MRWTQGVYARTKKGGRMTSVNSKKAECFCVMGAIYRVYRDQNISKAADKLRTVVGTGIINWNDAPERTFREVLAAAKKAGI